MNIEDCNVSEKPVAPGLQKAAEKKPKGRFGAGGPPGNRKAEKHGAYSAVSPEEEQERIQFENDLMADLADDVSTAQRALIRRAGFLEIRLRRCERADSKGLRIADVHILSWINAQRLLLAALGLKRLQASSPSLSDYLQKKAEEGMRSKCAN